MQRAILTNDSSLDVQPVPARANGLRPSPQQLPATLADFTGRDDILEQICLLLAPADGAVPQHLRVMTLTGKGGISFPFWRYEVGGRPASRRRRRSPASSK